MYILLLLCNCVMERLQTTILYMAVFPSSIYCFRSIRNFSDYDSSNPERRETHVPSGSRSVDSNLLSILRMWINVNFHPWNTTRIITKMYSGMSDLQYSFETTLMSYRSAVYLNDFPQSLFCIESYFLLYTMETIFAQLTTLYNMTLFLPFCTKVWWCFVQQKWKYISAFYILVCFFLFLPWCRCSWSILWWYSATTLDKYFSLFSLHAFNHCITWRSIY